MKKLILVSAFLMSAFCIVNAQQQEPQESAREMSKAELSKISDIVELLKVAYSSSDYSKYTFRSFDLKLNVGGSDVTEMAAGNLISEKQKALIADAPAGTRLSFEKIRALEHGKRDVSLLPGFFLVIK